MIRALPAWIFPATVALVTFVTLYARPYSALPQPNELSRLYLTRALAEQRSIDVLPQVRRYGIIHDLAAHRGRAFSDKAPGSSVLGLVGYGIARVFDDDPPVDNAELAFSVRRLVLLPISLLASLLLLPLVLRRLGIARELTLATAIAMAVGTIWLVYSQIYFGHVLAGGALLLMLFLLLEARDASDELSVRRRLLLAGAAAGVAGSLEYPAILASAALAGYALARFGWRRTAWLGLGAAPFALLLGIYHARAFDSPWTLPYQHLAWPEMRKHHEHGFAGVAFPSWEGIYGVFLSARRGLLVWSPLLLLAPWGLVRLARSDRALALAIGGALLSYLVVITGSSVWHGGWSTGPRLIVPIFPLAAIGVGLAFSAVVARRALVPLVLAPLFYSVALLPLVGAVLPGVSSQVATPLGDVHRPLLACGVLPHNLGHSLGLDGAFSLIPLGLALAALIALVACLALAAGADAGSIGVAMVVAAVGVYVATLPRSAAPAERAALVERFAEIESKELHRAGLGARRCSTLR
jgi:hypothetical protein